MKTKFLTLALLSVFALPIMHGALGCSARAEEPTVAISAVEDASGPAVEQEAPALSPAAESIVKAEGEGEAVEVPVDPNLSFLQLLLKSIGDMKGATTLAIIAIVIQLLIKLLDLPLVGSWFSGTKGKTKLMIVTGLTFALAPITLVSSLGLDWGAALTHSTTLAAFMVFVNQIFVQFKKDE